MWADALFAARVPLHVKCWFAFLVCDHCCVCQYKNTHVILGEQGREGKERGAAGLAPSPPPREMNRARRPHISLTFTSSD